MINNTTIKITRLSNIIYPSREAVILALDNVYHLIGQFILAEYRDELGNINTILVIGKSNGRGHDAYSVISTAGDFVVNKIEIPDVSQIGHQNPEVPHGEIYITRKKIDPNDENSEEDWFLVSCPESERVWEIIDRSRIFRNLDDGYRWFYIKETKTLKREDDFLSTAENQSYVNNLMSNFLKKPSIVVSYNNQTGNNFYINELNTTIENPILNIHITDFTDTDITEKCIIKINNEIIESETSDIHDFMFTGTFNNDFSLTIHSVCLELNNLEIEKTVNFYFPKEAYFGTCRIENNEIVINEDIRTKLIYSDLSSIDVVYNLDRNRSILIVPTNINKFLHIFDDNSLDYINDYTYVQNFEYNDNIYSMYYKNSNVVIQNFKQKFI
jgi:hypothetical protein